MSTGDLSGSSQRQKLEDAPYLEVRISPNHDSSRVLDYANIKTLLYPVIEVLRSTVLFTHTSKPLEEKLMPVSAFSIVEERGARLEAAQAEIA
ncbi:unnamed protein product [Arabis nemorensis]|uniref:Uncharacterized protein n=1 Tax=Arabis nemorensis TaxID=586526 RepID=A0A565CSY9_9BRAS|nr:unnamed protein product [Arabis nemorensis]